MIFASRLRSIDLRNQIIAIIVAIAVIALINQPTNAVEFKPDRRIPDFTLPAPDDSLLTLKTEKGQIVVTHNGKVIKPTVTIIHLFQPDCLQCQTQMQELEAIHQEFNSKNVVVLGIAHRGDAQSVRAVAQRLKITFPLVVGTGSPFARQFAAGDTLAITDRQATVRFAQVGYGKGDEVVWRTGIKLLLDGKPLAQKTVSRQGLKVGDRLPAIELQSLLTDKLIALTGQDGRLTFRDEEGKVIYPKAAIGMFSRFWAFSSEGMGHLQKIHEKYAKDGLLVFAIAIFPNVKQAGLITQNLGVTYPVFNGNETDLAKRYGYGWPAYIVDAGGVIRYTQVGFESGDEKKYERVIEEVLREK
jgi:peroxiredoxin